MISSRKNSQMRRRSSRNSQSTFGKLTASMQRFIMSNANRSKKDDDWSESWVPSKITDLEGGLGNTAKYGKSKRKNRSTDNVCRIFMALIGCALLGGFMGWMRGATVVAPKSGDASLEAKNLLKLASDGLFVQLHQKVYASVDHKCGKSVAQLNEDALAHFRSHVMEAVQWISEKGKFSVENPVVTSEGAIVEKKGATNSAYECSLLNDLSNIAKSTGEKDDSGKLWGEGYSQWDLSSSHHLTGDVGHDSRQLVITAAQGQLYNAEMLLRKASKMHCAMDKLTEKAQEMLHEDVMDVLERVITHREQLIEMKITPAIEKKTGMLIEPTTSGENVEYFTCPLITQTLHHATESLDTAMRALIDEIERGEFYSLEVQADLIIEHFGSERVKKFKNDAFHVFRSHFIDLGFQVATGGALGTESYVVLSDGGIATKSYALDNGHTNKEIKAEPIVDALVSFGDTQHENKNKGRFATDSSAAHDELEYIKTHKKDPIHDAKFLFSVTTSHDMYSLERVVPDLLDLHCDVIASSDDTVKRNAHDRLVSALSEFSKTGKSTIKSPRFNDKGDIISSDSYGSKCDLLTHVFDLVNGKNTPTNTVEKTPVQSSDATTRDSAKKSEQDKDVGVLKEKDYGVSKDFMKKSLPEQAKTVILNLRDNDWYDAHEELWYILETHCPEVMKHLSNDEAAATLHMDAFSLLTHAAVSKIEEKDMISVTKDGQLWAGNDVKDSVPCLAFDAFQNFAIANPPKASQVKQSLTKDELNAELHSEGHDSHIDDVVHDVNLIIEDARTSHVVDMEKDIANDLKTHCPDVVSKLRTSAKRKLHSKIVQGAQWVANGNSHAIVDAVVTAKGMVVSKSELKSTEKTYDCSLVAKLFSR